MNQKLCDDELIAACSPVLGLTNVQDLESATLIHIDGRHRPAPASDWSRWCDAAGTTEVNTMAGPHLPDSMSAVQAAIAGQGVVIVSRLLVANAITAGLLAQPFACAIIGEAYHFTTPADVAADADIDGLWQWFLDVM